MTVLTPQPASLYGRLIAACDIEQALVEQVERWLDLYLNETERQHGLELGWLARPRAYAGDERFVEDQLPAIVVKSPGFAELPEADGQGRYRTRFELELEAHVSSSDHPDQLAKLYAVALRALAVQQVPPLYMGIDLGQERYRRAELVGGRTYYIATVPLEAHVHDITDRHAGPPDEPGWPEDGGPTSPEWPVAQTADTELVKLPTEED